MSDGLSRLENNENAKPCDVFISYAHEDGQDHADELAEAMRRAGFDVWYDQGLARRGGQDWHEAIVKKMESATVIIALWTNHALSRPFCRVEAAYASGARKLLPVALEDLEASNFTEELEGLTYRLNRVDWDVAAIVAQVRERVDADEAARARRERERKLAAQPPSAALLAQERINLPAVLTSGSGFLAGRDAEESLLLDAWASCAPDAPGEAKTNIVVLHAIGGAGKTALMRRLVDRLAESDFPHADKVLGWSAYSQGSGENRNADSDAFIIDALRFFGELGELPPDAVARARLLVARLKETRTLLLLDGIEPLQSLPDVDLGRLKDKGLQRLIQDLAMGHPGLVVITSRQHLPELERDGVVKPGVKSHALDRLSARAGAHLLRHLRCWGLDRELEAAVEEAQGHALSTTLLGTYIDAVEAGDIGRRDHLGLAGIIDTSEELQATDETARFAKRAGAIMQGYITRFEALETTGRGEAERMLLSIVGLFDRPADGEAVKALLKSEPIPGLTDVYHAWTEGQRDGRLRTAKSRLRELKLLGAADEDDPDGLDAHPVVREHFAKALRAAAPEAFAAAHERLYRHYAAAAPNLPDRLAEMQPLFHAIGHACAAGLVQEAWDKVYQRRVNRGGTTFFLTNQLGAYAASLGVLAAFFDPPWAAPRAGLTDETARAAALNYAAFALRALARLSEAEEAQAAGLALREAQGSWANAARSAGNVSELRLALGRVGAAVEAGAQAAAHADSSGDAFQMMGMRTTHADALLQAGAGAKAAALFADAEARQAKRQPDLPRLYSLQGYQYCDLLLARGAAAAVRERIAEIAAWAQNPRWKPILLDDALYALADARALALIAAHGDAALAGTAAARLEEAVAALRAAGQDIYIISGLFARAGFHAQAFVRDGDPAHLKTAAEDLAEVEDIASSGGMRLFLTDWRLQSARLALAQIPGAPPQALVPLVKGEPGPDDPWPELVRPLPPGAEPPKSGFLGGLFGRKAAPAPPPSWRDTPLTTDERRLLASAEEHTQEAAALIEETGYLRRDPELKDLRERLDMLAALT